MNPLLNAMSLLDIYNHDLILLHMLHHCCNTNYVYLYNNLTDVKKNQQLTKDHISF
jgi:hypothetical protein